MLVRRATSHLLLTIAIAAAAIHAVAGQDRGSQSVPDRAPDRGPPLPLNDFPVSGQGVAIPVPPNEECYFRQCCQEDCCGSNTSWSTASSKCIPDPGSDGFDDEYSSDYEFGCIQRDCCESDCCANGTQYDETTISCTSCQEQCTDEDNASEGSIVVRKLPPVFGGGPPVVIDVGVATGGDDRDLGRFLQAAEEDDGTYFSRSLEINFRSPFGPGKITLVGCNAANLNNMAIIPETGTNVIFPPVNDKEYDADGIYFRREAPTWYKVPDHCSAIMTCLGTGDLQIEYNCNFCASICFGKPRDVNGGHPADPPPGF